MMSRNEQRGSLAWNWDFDSIDCHKFVDFTKADSPQVSTSLDSDVDTHEDSPAFIEVGRAHVFPEHSETQVSRDVGRASQDVKERAIPQPQKSACTSNVASGSDSSKAPLSNATPSCVHKTNYALHSLKQGRTMRETKDQTSSLSSSSACRSTSAAHSYSSNPLSRTGMSTLLSKFSSPRVRSGHNAKQASQASKVSPVKNVKGRNPCPTEPRKLGQPLRAQSMNTVLWSHPVMTKQAGLSTSTKTAHPITAAAPRSRPGPVAGPWRHAGGGTTNCGTLKNYDRDKTLAPAAKSDRGVCDKELKK
ncbi:hypothetical protein MTO96_020997 [Rhipicephalus appendiculatus]